MSTAIKSILHKAIDNSKDRNILNLGFDGWFESTIANTNHNWFMSKDGFIIDDIKPKNINYVHNTLHQMPADIAYDMLTFNDEKLQYDIAQVVSRAFHIPNLLICHNGSKTRETLKTKNVIFTHELIKDSYDSDVQGDVIKPPITIPEVNVEDKFVDVLVYGSFTGQDINLLHFLKSQNFSVDIVGDNPGFSKNVDQDTLKQKMANSKIFLTFTRSENIQTVILEAMARGCSIISTIAIVLMNFITSDRGTLLDDGGDLSPAINRILDGAWKDMSHNNIDLIKEQFDAAKNIPMWDERLTEISKEVYTI